MDGAAQLVALSLGDVQLRPGAAAHVHAVFAPAGRAVVAGGDDLVVLDDDHDTSSCSMCRRLIINAGLSKVIARTGPGTYTVTEVREWIESDDTLR